MTPAMAPGRRGSGSWISPDVVGDRWHRWRCLICLRTGREFGYVVARGKWERHYARFHGMDGVTT